MSATWSIRGVPGRHATSTPQFTVVIQESWIARGPARPWCGRAQYIHLTYEATVCFRRDGHSRRRCRRDLVARKAGVVDAAHKERALSPPRPSPAAGRPSLVLPAAVDWNAPRIIESGRSERQSIAEEAEPVFWIPNFFLWGPGRTGEESPRKLWKLLVGKQAKKWRYLIACLSTYIL